MRISDWSSDVCSSDLVQYPQIDYQAISYYSTPKSMTDGPKSLDEVDPKLLETYAKLGIPLREQEMLAGVQKPQVAVDVVFDSGRSAPRSARHSPQPA